tara:strand:+ start:349 stop:759 length:411 start_codon:yes stop_codon:yes gene_type:complete
MKRSVNEYDENRGGGYQIPRTRTKSNDQEALDYLGAGFGAAGAAATAAMAMRPKRTDEDLLEAADQTKRESDAEMKRESRGVKKPANFDAIQEAKQDAKDAADRKKIKDMGYKAGGSVSSASKRADGIAIRGKTRA